MVIVRLFRIQRGGRIEERAVSSEVKAGGQTDSERKDVRDGKASKSAITLADP